LFCQTAPSSSFAVFALTKIGSVFVPSTPSTPPRSRSTCAPLRNLRRAHVAGAFAADRVGAGKAADLKAVECDRSRRMLRRRSWNKFLTGVSANAPRIDIDPEDLARSPTLRVPRTGQKASCCPSTIRFCPRMRAEGLGWTENDRVLCVLPLFHVNALCHTCLAMLSVGAASCFWKSSAPRAFGMRCARTKLRLRV